MVNKIKDDIANNLCKLEMRKASMRLKYYINSLDLQNLKKFIGEYLLFMEISNQIVSLNLISIQLKRIQYSYLYTSLFESWINIIDDVISEDQTKESDIVKINN